jgi:peroxiredoxin
MSATSLPIMDTLTGFDVRRFSQHLRSLVVLRGRNQPASTLRVCVSQGGLQPGTPAPDFTLPRVGGRDCSLSDFAGQRLLLVFVRPDGRDEHGIAEELNRIQRCGDTQVLAIHGGRPHEAALWADEVLAAFPVLTASDRDIAGRYEASVAPLAFVIDERGRVAASGVVSQPRTLSGMIAAAAKH